MASPLLLKLSGSKVQTPCLEIALGFGTHPLGSIGLGF